MVKVKRIEKRVGSQIAENDATSLVELHGEIGLLVEDHNYGWSIQWLTGYAGDCTPTYDTFQDLLEDYPDVKLYTGKVTLKNAKD